MKGILTFVPIVGLVFQATWLSVKVLFSTRDALNIRLRKHFKGRSMWNW